MSKVVIYVEQYSNLPSEKGSALFIASFFTVKNVKYSIEQKQNVENFNKFGEPPFYSINGILCNGTSQIIAIYEGLIQGINNKGDDDDFITKALSERIKSHEEIIQFNYAKNLFQTLFYFNEWKENPGLSSRSYMKRYCWPLNKIMLRKKLMNMDRFLKSNYWCDSSVKLMEELKSYLGYLNNQLQDKNNVFLNNSPTVERLDVLVCSQLHIIQRERDKFIEFIDIIDKYPDLLGYYERFINQYPQLEEICHNYFDN